MRHSIKLLGSDPTLSPIHSLDSILAMPPCPRRAAQPTFDWQPNPPAEPGRAMAPQRNERANDGDVQARVPNAPCRAPRATTAR